MNDSPATPIVRPTPGDVGALLHARTRDDDGNELGTFTAATRPTAVQTTTIIATAASMLAPRLRRVPADYADTVRAAVALQAAILVEGSYYPEQAAAADSYVASLRLDLNALLASLDEALANAGQNVPGPDGSYGSVPVATMLTLPYDADRAYAPFRHLGI